MNNEVMPNELTVTHIHGANVETDSFIEFIKLDNGKSFVLRFNTFVNRYGREPIKTFKSEK